MSAYNLCEVSRRAVLEKKKFKIVRVDHQADELTKSFWFSAYENIETEIFSARDLNSYWLILNEMIDFSASKPEPAKETPE